MKKLSILPLIMTLCSVAANANGVTILDAHNATYLRMDSTIVQVSVESQISTTTTTQYYINTHPTGAVKYGFPLPEQASAVQLRWEVEGEWYVASVAGTSQDTTLPGGGTPDAGLLSYLGKTPLYFSIPQPIQMDSTLVVELTYVELLPYASGNVNYVYPADYHLIQSEIIALQKFSFSLTSPRTIDSINVVSNLSVDELTNDGASATVRITQYELQGNQNVTIRYTLNATELGLYSYTSSFPDSVVPDSLGNGFLTFIAEPDPGSITETIAKVFTLIVDRSGSMGGTKIQQARDAASFIVENLNSGDRFNIIDFDDIITPFRPGHVPYTAQTRDSALEYISTLTARGLTNISGAFATGVPQFAAANDSTANIIIFLTDGLPTIGIQNTETLVAYVDSLVTATETNISLFCFGIGADVNQQLLALMAANNKGIAEFLGNDELYSRITGFYLTIRSPVLLNSHISFNPPVVSDVYPDSLPNLYKGRQMIVAGRYQQAVPVDITLSGTAFGHQVSYTYNVQLADSSVPGTQFLPKVWAKRTIESLLIHYYALNLNSVEALALKARIKAISQAYGVISPFTSFTGVGTTGVEEKPDGGSFSPAAFELLGNYPNPFNPSTTIRLRVNSEFTGILEIRIYSILGQLVRTLHMQIHGRGIYSVSWDGHGERGESLGTGVYLYAADMRNTVLVGKMSMLK